MINSESIKTIVRRDGAAGAVHTIYQLLGLENPETGKRHWNQELDQPVLESDAPWTPSMLSVKELARGFIGCDGDELERALGQSCRAHREADDVLEAGAAVVPSQFANISAFNAATAGLLEARMLEAYTRPQFVLTNIVETIPSDKRQEKLIGVGMVGDTAEERKPHAPHHRISVPERYVTSPLTVNRGNGVDVTREAVMFDLTRELLTQAESASETLGLRKEYLITDCVIGVTNTYDYNGTVYNTYLTSGNWINKLGGNPLTDWTAFNAANQLFAQMTDQETGQPIEIEVKQVLVMPYKEMSSRYVFNFTGLENTSSDLTRRGFAPNPLGGGRYEFLPPSKYAYRRATDANGLNLSATNAQVYWWLGDFKRAFAWVQNLPLTIVRATATDYHMADRGLMFSLFADEMGVPMVKDPRFVVLSTN